jgi:hypothetical protein
MTIDPKDMVGHCRRLIGSNERAHVDPDTIAMATYIIDGAHERDRLRDECKRHEEAVRNSFSSMKDVTETLDTMLPVIDRWREQHGEAIAKELITAYLSGVDDALKTLMALGAGGQHVFFERLRGN